MICVRVCADQRSPRPYAAPAPFRLGHVHKGRHMAAVDECRERIFAGEIYQANICLRLETRWGGPARALCACAGSDRRRARAAPFGRPWGGIASLSPELFLRRAGDAVVTAPIKGTIKRARRRHGAERRWPRFGGP